MVKNYIQVYYPSRLFFPHVLHNASLENLELSKTLVLVDVVEVFDDAFSVCCGLCTAFGDSLG